jgi:hypothetical protein
LAIPSLIEKEFQKVQPFLLLPSTFFPKPHPLLITPTFSDFRSRRNCLTQSRIFSIKPMPRYTVGTSNNSLPPRTLEYLAKGASAGSRHNELFAAACQFRDCGYDLNETAKQCVPRAIKDGLDEAEAGKTVASVFRHAPRGRPQKTGTASTTSSAGGGSGGGGAGQSEETAPPPPLTPEKLPDPIPDGLLVLVETLFKPGEGIAIGAGSRAPAAISSSIEASSARGTAGRSHCKSVRWSR